MDHSFVDNFTDESLLIAPIENPDWGYARNKRCVLMVPSAEWVQSVYSTQFELNGKKFIVPNRDYPYEGLSVYHDGENWKFIDCIALAVQNEENSYLSFVADSVRVDPWQVSYCYKVKDQDKEDSEERPFFVTYYLDSKNTPQLITGCIELSFPKGLVWKSRKFIPTIQPFLDIRHMYASSDFYAYRYGYRNGQQSIWLSSYNRTLTFYLPPVQSTLFDRPELLNWYYKLGTGSRIETTDNRTIFIGENKSVAAFFHLQIPSSCDQKFVRLFWSCEINADTKNTLSPTMEKMKRNTEESLKEDHLQFEQLKKIFPLKEKYRDALLARIVGLLKFKTYIQCTKNKYTKVPHAGAWWFRTPWYRDVFEGILNSFETLMKIPEERENIKEIILLALRDMHKTFGLIPNRLPEYNASGLAYNGSDSTLLCYVVANAYIEKTKDIGFAKKILAYIEKTFDAFEKNNNQPSVFSYPDSPPRIDSDSGLLLSSPHHSWIDTRNECVECHGQKMNWVPRRYSFKFINEIYESASDKNNLGEHLSSSNFFLPEINAQWILMLKGTLATIDLVEKEKNLTKQRTIKDDVNNILSLATKNFKEVFWNNDKHFLFNVVYKDNILKDEIEGEPAIVASAMLGEAIFSRDELRSIWNTIREKLLVNRRLVMYGDEMLPFGIITKNEDQRTYYNDNQYHSDVVWLRSTPYLITLLRLLDENKIIENILLNTLDHQITEGGIFYNQELFSKPFGNNPSPEVRTCQNPVPVKNPIQFWSQWCDGFMREVNET